MTKAVNCHAVIGPDAAQACIPARAAHEFRLSCCGSEVSETNAIVMRFLALKVPVPSTRVKTESIFSLRNVVALLNNRDIVDERALGA